MGDPDGVLDNLSGSTFPGGRHQDFKHPTQEVRVVSVAETPPCVCTWTLLPPVRGIPDCGMVRLLCMAHPQGLTHDHKPALGNPDSALICL